MKTTVYLWCKALQKGHYRLKIFGFSIAAKGCGIGAGKVAGEASISRIFWVDEVSG